ncbi:hypothetical protein C8R47DRAFT_937191, partial [Mycena vitilis]
PPPSFSLPPPPPLPQQQQPPPPAFSQQPPPSFPPPPPSAEDNSVPSLRPADDGTWLAEVYGEVSAKNLGGEYNSLLRIWMSLERAYKYERKTGKVAWNTKSAGRPAAVDKWVGVGRGRGGKGTLGNGVGPPIDDVDAFAAGWWRWWAGFQPAWRVKDPARAERFLRQNYPAASAANWGSMRYPGPNGALNFVATLYWWGMAVAAKGSPAESWWEAVEEVRWMLTGLLAV